MNLILPDVDKVREPPDLSSAELERLAVLAEELGEAIQAVGKILRHGYKSGNPFGVTTNKTDLQNELGHVLWAMQLMIAANDISSDEVFKGKKEKMNRKAKYLHWQDKNDHE